MDVRPDNPLIVQSDHTVLLEVDGPRYPDARDALAAFAELVKSPEHIHTYRITPLSIWNAAAAGHGPGEMVEALTSFAKYPVPQNVVRDIRDYASRYGRVRLVKEEGRLLLESDDELLLREAWATATVRRHLVARISPTRAEVDPSMRGHVKQAMIRLGYPVEDLAGYVDGGPLEIELQESDAFRVRAYQADAVDAFWAGGSARGGSGVIVLPCGAGKTIVGMAAMARLGRKTLILTTNLTAVRQWKDELREKCRIAPADVGEYTGERKEIRPTTVTTYQILTYRRSKTEAFVHFGLFSSNDWGLIIYDEVHLLPAPVFRVTAEIQATRRLGLTATLVREDNREEEVFTLIGPKRYDVPWKLLEKQGYIAQATCTEVRIPMHEDQRVRYAGADRRQKFRIASENPLKLDTLRRLLAHHQGDLVLVIGQYLRQLKEIAKLTRAPIITGRTPNDERAELYGKFRRGEIKELIVSKVGNFAIDLPDASVLIQMSGTFGSRQEEAQRLGRILRPKADNGLAHFYSLVTRDTLDQDYAQNRQLFLTEQGYSYQIVDDREVE
ncbi:MAG: DNA repair helicase XPB [Planctomycetota bacterium]|jgi:DNA excision repair protein ERCC-3